MIGEIEPLKALLKKESRASVIDRVIQEYPTVTLDTDQPFYRIRKAPKLPQSADEYDSPPRPLLGNGRLDSCDLPVMYASPDLQVCIHECRITAEDDLFAATLSPLSALRLLDVSALLPEENITEFESLDMAINMLFLAGNHSYEITRAIAHAVYGKGYDGLIYPSYFSLLRTGTMPFETVYGLSNRLIPSLRDYEQAKYVPNLALFGYPIQDKKVEVRSINKLILSRVEYEVRFGPVGF